MKTFKTQPCEILFAENDGAEDISSKIQLLRTGTFSYWEPGDMEINSGVLESMVSNFHSKIRGIDLAIDYSHNMFDEAAGWIKNVFLSDDKTQLWAEVEWTPKAKKCLKDKEYRYLSSEFSFSYKDNEKMADHGPTLFGAGLTNRPFVKNMDPVVPLQEYKEPEMTLEEMKKQMEAQAEQLRVLKEESEAKEKKIKEMEQRSAAEKILQEKNSKFDKLLSEAKVVEAQRQAFIDNDMVRFAELAGNIKLQSIGHDKAPEVLNDEGLTADQAEDKIMKLAEAVMTANKVLSFKDAVVDVLKSNPVLAKKYNSKFQ